MTVAASQALDYSMFDGKLRHPLAAFTPPEVKARAERLGQPAATARIETFAWLLEVGAQLSEQLGPAFALRGGTNVQLRLDPELQRASQDIDAVFRGTVAELQAAMAALSERFADCEGFLQFERLQRDFPPTDFAAWSCSVPAVHGGLIYDGLPRRLLSVEVTLIGEGLPTEPLTGTVFGLRFADGGVGLTRGALIGDKLLTLGPDTTGIRGADDRLARQIYDLDNLAAANLDAATLSEAAATATYLAPVAGGHRSLEIDASAALTDAVAQAIRWGQLSLPSGPDKRVGLEIRAWQGANVPLAKQIGIPGWATRALRVALIGDAVRQALTDPEGAADGVAASRELVARAAPVQAAIAAALVAEIGAGANALRNGDPARPALLAHALLGSNRLMEIVDG